MVDLTGYKLTFDDEFNTRSISQTGANTTWSDIRPEWRYDANSDIGFGTSSFVDPASGYDPFDVSGGALSITAVPDRTTSGYPGSAESGLISTEGKFSQTYGYFEMRAQTSGAPGSWDAFWMLPDKPAANPTNSPGWQELDVVEHYGGNDSGVYSTIHTTDQTPNIPWQVNRQVYSETPGLSAGYHTYGMDWELNTISFYVDGKLVGSQATPSDMHSPMYLLADLATQSGASGSPMTTKIDYIRAYSKDPSAVAVAQGTVSAPDGRDPGLYGATTANAPAVTAQPTGSNSTGNTATGSITSATGSTSSTVGTGSDKLVLSMSEDSYQGDAQYTVSVDGKQIGGVQTAHSAHGTATDTLTIQGDWSVGAHTVSVDFLNDLYAGTASTDRNLYIDGATYDGTAVSGAQHSLMSTGVTPFVFQDVGSNATAAAGSTPAGSASASGTSTGSTASATGSTSSTVGTGSDKLVLSMSEDSYQGDAQYTVSVDGKQIGGVQTAHSAHGTATDTLTVQGDWSVGAHTVSVDFLNDLYAGTASTDRNLYIGGATYDGTAVSGAQHSLMSTGVTPFVFQDVGSNATAAAGSTPAGSASASGTSTGSTASATGSTSSTVGTGSDKLVLSMSEDSYQGDAQYTVSVDGKQIGGVQTAHSAHGTATDTLTIQGDWSVGAHTVSVDFLNDLYAGTASTDRNLYIDGATYDGTAVSGAQHSLMSTGVTPFVFQDVGSNATAAAGSTPAGSASASGTSTGSTASATGSTSSTVGTGSDKLVLSMSEDSYQGDAQYTVSVDGKQIGGVQTAHSAHGTATDTLTVQGDWSVGAHTVSVDFLNDLYAGTASTDRNLYIDGATYDGTALSGAQHSLMSSGVQNLSFTGHKLGD